MTSLQIEQLVSVIQKIVYKVWWHGIIRVHCLSPKLRNLALGTVLVDYL